MLAAGFSPHFLGAGGLAAAARSPAPAVFRRRGNRPAAVSSSNGLRAVNRAMELMLGGSRHARRGGRGSQDPGARSRPTIRWATAGFPTRTAWSSSTPPACTGPRKRAGAVAALEGIKTPSEVARLVLKYTDHILLVGEGAKRFALSYGFKEEDLLTRSRASCGSTWRANRGPDDDWLDVPDERAHGRAADRDHQPQRGERRGRRFVGDHHQRPRVEDSRPGRRLAHRGRGPIHRQRRGRGRVHRAGRVEHHGVWRIPDGRADAPGHEADRRLPGDAQAGDAPRPRRAVAQPTAGPGSISSSTRSTSGASSEPPRCIRPSMRPTMAARPGSATRHFCSRGRADADAPRADRG